MQASIDKLTRGLLIAGFTALTSLGAHAQNRIGGAVQQGHGAYVQKATRGECMINTLLGIPGLAATACVTMTQEKFMVTPSGNSTSIWRGTVPAESRPVQQVVFNSTYTEVADGPTKGLVYDTVAITQPDGSVTLTLTRKPNGKGADGTPGNGNGRVRYKGKA